MQLRFIDLGGLRRSVMNAAVEGLANVSKTSDKWMDIGRDIEHAEILFNWRLQCFELR